MTFLLSVAKENYGDKIIETLGLSETLLFGLEVLLIGLLTVFSVLIIIWIAMVLFKVFFYDLPSKSSHRVSEAPAIVAVKEIAPVESADDEIVAVIAAAVAMAEAEAGGAKFRVVSFRRK